VFFDAINIFSKGINTMATADQNTTVTTPVYNSNPDTFVGPAQQLTNQGIPAGYDMGVAYDEQGNLLPGWALDPSGQFAVQTDPNYVDPKTQAQALTDRQDFQNSQAFNSDGTLKDGYTYDEFGTPVKVDTAMSDQKTGNSDSPATVDHGPAYDDNGNLYPGWALDENNDPVWVGGDYVDQKTVDSAAETRAAQAASHGAPYDDEGNLMPGWSLNEDGDPVWVGGDFVEPATAASAKASREAAAANRTGATAAAKGSNAITKQVATEPDDWRVRLSLAPNAKYLYGAAKAGDILFPLVSTGGVIFPYTPQVQTSYRANYDPGELTHSNYKMYFYKNSSVDDITITADFTAQDTSEANYLLAVIHFFKSATKMFYGRDESPRAGTPPPLLYLSGFGAYQFDRHPLLLTNFTYNMPNDVDYIRAGSTKTWGGTNIAQLGSKAVNSAATTPWDRLKSAFGSKVNPGGTKAAPNFSNSLASADSTYVPTKIQIQLSFVPVVTRKDISDRFSVEKYATGSLTRGSRNNGGGIW
jgi:hypothetical protein